MLLSLFIIIIIIVFIIIIIVYSMIHTCMHAYIHIYIYIYYAVYVYLPGCAGVAPESGIISWSTAALGGNLTFVRNKGIAM